MKRSIWIAAVALAPMTSHAWDSRCFQYTDNTLEAAAYRTMRAGECVPDAGPNTARQRWIGGTDEHRQIWDFTSVLAGLPDSLGQSLRIRVYTGSTPVAITPTFHPPSFAPVAFSEATRAQTRVFTISELTQLPDFSYGLWDWATGNETCPLDGVNANAAECHAFSTHMGPVNANHFPPMSGEFYRRYHSIALGRAQQCSQMATALAPAASRHNEFVLACESEALAIEAVAQHYLEDAWSMGHMWQRWGSPTLGDMPGATGDERRMRAMLVGMAAGLFHGAHGLLQALPEWTTYRVDDPLSAPHENTYFVLGGRLTHGLGDLYLHTMIAVPGVSAPDPRYEPQYARMTACMAAGMLQVYRAAGQSHGALRAGAPLASVNVDPLSGDCWAQRATNHAMLIGAGIDYSVLGHQTNMAKDARSISMELPAVGASSGSATVDQRLKNTYRLHLQRSVSVLRVLAGINPSGTEAAEGGLGDLLGIHPNGAYARHTPIAPYVDPDLPWPATRDRSMPHADERAAALGRLFHRAHAADWCASTTNQDLQRLRAHTADTSLDLDGRLAACEVCVEFASRHLRVGSNARRYDASLEPVCGYLAPTGAFVYQAAQAGTDVNGLTRAWCGCDQQPAAIVPVAPVQTSVR